MKKLIAFILMVLVLTQYNGALATFSFSLEKIERGEVDNPPLTRVIVDIERIDEDSEKQIYQCDLGYLREINGELYYNPSNYRLIKYVEEESKFFVGKDYLKCDDVYMARSVDYGMPEYGKAMYPTPIEFYDMDFNLITEHDFERYIGDISYSAGTYYCYLSYSNELLTAHEPKAEKNYSNQPICIIGKK